MGDLESARGERQLIDRCATQHFPWILNWFRSRGLPREEAEDLCQEVFLILLRKDAAALERNHLARYLLGIARNVLRSHRRTKKPEQLADPTGVPVDHTADERLPTRLGGAIARLPGELEEIILVYYSRRITYEQVAELMGVSRATVQSRLRRAIEQLRHEMRALEKNEP